MIQHTLDYQKKRTFVVHLDYRTELKEGFELEPDSYYGPLEIVEALDGKKYWGIPTPSSIDYYPISDEMYETLKQHFKSLDCDKVTYMDGKRVENGH